MQLRPKGARVLLQRVATDAVSQGGIIIPETAREKPQIGLVLDVGEGRWLPDGSRRPVGKDVDGSIAYGVGDKVIFLKYNGVEVPDPECEAGKPGAERLIVDEDFIIAKYERE